MENFVKGGCKSVRPSCCQRCLGIVPHLQGQGGGAWIAEAWGRRPSVKDKGLEQLSAELWGARSTVDGEGGGAWSDQAWKLAPLWGRRGEAWNDRGAWGARPTEGKEGCGGQEG